MRELATAGGRAITGALLGLALAAAPAVAATGPVVTRPVVFVVHNTNRTQVPCTANGATYQVRGQLVGPAHALEMGGGPATLYLHGLGFGVFFWNFSAVPGYDFAASLGELGHVSVILDRLGYGASDHPPGSASCIGSQADEAHQIIQQLRAGAYSVGNGRPVAFGKVALVGHSVGGAIAQVESYSFHDVGALGVLSYADQGQSPLALETFGVAGLACATGGAQSGGAPGYAPFGMTPADFDAAMFHDADRAVVAAAAAMRNLDPCGDDESLAQSIVVDQAQLATISVPVLLLYGASDALFPPPAGSLQKLHFLSSHDVRLVELPDTGHAVTLERSHRALVADLSAWLSAHGF